MLKFQKSIISFLLFMLSVYNGNTQTYRWQMRVRYKMDIDFFVEKNQYRGIQILSLINNSPDTINELFYHLYFNAFQPNSDMDIRSRTIEDPDSRIGSRILNLKEDEIGYIRIDKIIHKGKRLSHSVLGTILRVDLDKALLPGDSLEAVIKFNAQVPVQIRRSGRFNREGVDYSMAQWYPKLCNYDEQGWHTDPYIAREFYAPWGDFDVNIGIDERYVVAATGYLEDSLKHSKGGRKYWHFYAPMVHDFVWAADPDYVRTERLLKDGRTLQFYHIPNLKYDSAWLSLPEIMEKALEYVEGQYGAYAYKTYSFIQGGDGGMEYPMATLITGNRPLVSLVGVCLHEWMHSWFEMMLATNESLYPWMDEGFTSYAEADVMNYIKSLGLIPGYVGEEDPMGDTRLNFIKFIRTGKEEALSTHSDHYRTNQAYGVASYVKGALCLSQLKYIMGSESFHQGMLDYYRKWKFRHPNPNDFFRVMEQSSNLELDWFKEYWVYTTKTIDYAVDTCYQEGKKTKIILRRKGLFPMPVDLEIITKSDSIFYSIPLDLMRGNKKEKKYKKLMPWHWVNPIYQIELNLPLNELKAVHIDPENQMVDTNPDNNSYRILD